MGFLSGKRVLIVGVANERSIASGIAAAASREGASLAFTYVNERFMPRVKKIAETFGSEIVLPCDLSDDDQIVGLFDSLSSKWPDGLDAIVHSAAFAPKDQIDGDYISCLNREGFHIAHDISSYSFGALAKYGSKMLNKGGALLALTYLGARKVAQNYNVMGLAKASLEANVRYLAYSLGKKGIRVNAVSAGPIRTLAAAGIAGFKKILSFDAKVNPLRRNVSIEEVGNVAAFLCSDLASGVTGEIVHVDSGFHSVAVSEIES